MSEEKKEKTPEELAAYVRKLITSDEQEMRALGAELIVSDKLTQEMKSDLIFRYFKAFEKREDPAEDQNTILTILKLNNTLPDHLLLKSLDDRD